MSQHPVSDASEDPSILLPARLDTKAAAALKDELTSGNPVPLDGSEVSYLGGLCLQLILSSQRRIINPSTKLSEALTLFGVPSFLQETATLSASPDYE